MKSNCIVWAWRQWRRYGGYAAMRRSEDCRFIPHVFWAKKLRGPWLSYSPVAPVRKLRDLVWFEGRIKEGDE